jgi:hypothetical protein
MSSPDPPPPPLAPLPLRVTASRDVLHQEVNGQMVLLHLAAERYYSLNDVATRVWTLLVRSHLDVEGTVRRLVAEYDVDEARARRDVAALLARLADAGLVRAEPA